MTRIILLVLAAVVAMFVIGAIVHAVLYWAFLILLVGVVGIGLYRIGRWSGGRSQRQ